MLHVSKVEISQKATTPPGSDASAAMPVMPGPISRIVRAWFYRLHLVISTLLVSWVLFLIQGSLRINSVHVSFWQNVTRWVEVVWIIPMPVALIFWFGWFIFAQRVQPAPYPISVPGVALDQGDNEQLLFKTVCLVFRFVTRGDNIDVLRESIKAIHEAFIRYPSLQGTYRIEIVTEAPVDVADIAMQRINTYIVPKAFETIRQSRFKARAMTYLQTQTQPQPEDWHIYLDEESVVDEVFLASVYQFISRSEQYMRLTTHHRPQGIIGQGTIIYQGGHWFFRAADAMRTADDLGRFRLQYGLGIPLFGMHGSFIVVRGVDDAVLSFDVGPGNSIAEDAAWALHAWQKGFRFAWVEGYLYEQPPQTIRDFVKQRSRWLIGIRGVLRDTTLPIRYRLCLGIFTYSWHLSILPIIVAFMALFTRTVAFTWVQFPANFAWAVFFLAYLQGIDLQVIRSAHFFSHKKPSAFWLCWKRIIACPLALGIFWYTLLEGFSILYSTIFPNQGFFVIRKPQLNRRKKEAI